MGNKKAETLSTLRFQSEDFFLSQTETNNAGVVELHKEMQSRQMYLDRFSVGDNSTTAYGEKSTTRQSKGTC